MIVTLVKCMYTCIALETKQIQVATNSVYPQNTVKTKMDPHNQGFELRAFDTILLPVMAIGFGQNRRHISEYAR